MTQPGNRRILLIDDAPSIHDDFRKILVDQRATPELDAMEAALAGQPERLAVGGFELDSAYHGREGTAMAEAALRAGRPYALAFVDMRMPPGWDGVETIEQLWCIDAELQVVICTAYSDQPWEQVMARLDMRDRLLVVKKPFDMIEVSQLARTLTAKWEVTRQAATRIESLASALAQLRASEAALRQSHHELETFARSLSHDLRAPLTAMSSFSHLLAAELQGTIGGRALHYLSRIKTNAMIGDRLIDGLLSLDGVSRAPMSVEPVDLGALARQLLEEFQQAQPEREVGLSIQEDLWADADRNLAKIALRHLLHNAWKFSSGRKPARIEVGGRDGAPGEPVFFVRDNGDGFDMNYVDKLFQTFQRLHNDPGLEGSGLGLVTVSRIVKRHGGRVWAQSRPGAGATFYFTLPSIGPDSPPMAAAKG